MMLAISVLAALALFGGLRLLRAVWLVARAVPKRNDDMIFF
jgi:hypothetical protein